VAIYVDGNDETEATIVNTLNASILGTEAVFFGSRESGNQPLTGSMDDIAIFNRVLSSTEVTNLYNGTFGGRNRLHIITTE
jgi:hypothetical protein